MVIVVVMMMMSLLTYTMVYMHMGEVNKPLFSNTLLLIFTPIIPTALRYSHQCETIKHGNSRVALLLKLIVHCPSVGNTFHHYTQND